MMTQNSMSNDSDAFMFIKFQAIFGDFSASFISATFTCEGVFCENFLFFQQILAKTVHVLLFSYS